MPFSEGQSVVFSPVEGPKIDKIMSDIFLLHCHKLAGALDYWLVRKGTNYICEPYFISTYFLFTSHIFPTRLYKVMLDQNTLSTLILWSVSFQMARVKDLKPLCQHVGIQKPSQPQRETHMFCVGIMLIM